MMTSLGGQRVDASRPASRGVRSARVGARRTTVPRALRPVLLHPVQPAGANRGAGNDYVCARGRDRTSGPGLRSGTCGCCRESAGARTNGGGRFHQRAHRAPAGRAAARRQHGAPSSSTPATSRSTATTTSSTRSSCRRARHEAFPCFDQPDLKARWTLTLDVPDGLGGAGERRRRPARARRAAGRV